MKSLMRLGKVLLFPLLIMLYSTATVIPKNKKLWLFGAWNGQNFSDNPKYIFKYILSERSDIEIFWVTKSYSLYRKMESSGFPVLYAWSLKGIFKQVTAGVVIFTHAVSWEFIAPLIASRVKRTLTWHGIPIKKIGLDDRLNQKILPKFKSLYTVIFPYKKERIDLIFSASASDQKIYSSAFDVPLDKVKITGYPRNDKIIESLSKSLFQKTSCKSIIYMPTLRGAAGSSFELFNQGDWNFSSLDKFFREINCEFHIKLHPAQKIKNKDKHLITNCKSIFLVDAIDDLYETLYQFDALITDYSGIYFDFLLTGKPIFILATDLKEYSSFDREIYYPLSSLSPQPLCLNMSDLKRQIQDFVILGSYDYDRYKALQTRFHEFIDANSSRRAFDAIYDLNFK